ncbi:hypothetical protein [Noviherbaspirillum aridicola]|uniref:Lipoprotein n=1 Tax=Noviherbaspirillum aridicola TaxID=2849687 RepID=A0ABQ4Q6B9_9BURK|nr:hypothetical protein [Noviherbaspirillum aridicola]GIZ52763.1 hypothetical protein NCCP691_27770 [Noviherbaspirillum aridicola]
MLREKFVIGLAALSLLAGLSACQKRDEASAEKGPAEKAGAQVDAATSKAGDALNKAGEKTGQALQSAGEKTGEAVRQGGEKLEGTAQEAQKKE